MILHDNITSCMICLMQLNNLMLYYRILNIIAGRKKEGEI